MSFITNFVQRVRRPSAKHLVTAGIFALAVAGSIGLGVHVRNSASAAVIRDCKENSIDYKAYPSSGDCGAADGNELIADIKNNSPSDLQTVYSHFGLNSSVYTQFANTEQQGQVNRDGTVTVNGDTVMTDVQTYGRDNYGGRTAETIGGKTYYHGAPKDSFADGVNSLPAMVMFDSKGVAQIVVINACGNPTTGHPVTPTATCTALNQSGPSASNPNTYSYTTTASFSGNAKFDHVVYHFSDTNTDVTETSLTKAVSHTFTKSGTVTTTVYAKVPGGHIISSVAVIKCQKSVTYVAPYYVCSNLVASAVDDNTFRFTVKTNQDKYTTVKNADFILDGKTTTSGVNTKDATGNIYKEYSFTDSVSHKVSVTVYFNTLEGVKSDAGHCVATVTPKQKPMCTVPGHTNLPPDSPDCAYCQPGIPVGSAECTPPVTPPTTPPTTTTTPTALVNTGPGSTVALFAVVTIAGYFGRKFFLSRRVRRESTIA